MRKALEQMGFKNRYESDGTYKNAYQDFCSDAQTRFEEILHQEYLRYYVEDKHMKMEDIEELEIIHPAKGKGKQNLDPDVFRTTKELENRKCAVQADLMEITEQKETVEEEVKVARRRLKKANTEAEKAQDTLLDMFVDADEMQSRCELEVAQMRLDMEEELVDAEAGKDGSRRKSARGGTIRRTQEEARRRGFRRFCKTCKGLREDGKGLH